MSGDIIVLHLCTKNYGHMMYGSWDMVRNRRTDGQMDRQTDGHTDGQTDEQTKKRHIEVGAPPKKRAKNSTK